MGLGISYNVQRGTVVDLEPIAIRHAAGLYTIGQRREDWRYLPVAGFSSPEDAGLWVSEALDLAAEGSQLTYVLVDPGSGQVMGSSRYLNIRPAHRVVEIGYSWLGPDYQRTAVNTGAKLLMLQNAFDVMGANRVEFKTDSRNTCSQRAIERLGACREGVLRSHMVAQGGVIRDSIMYSIVKAEWPGVRRRLNKILVERGKADVSN